MLWSQRNLVISKCNRVAMFIFYAMPSSGKLKGGLVIKRKIACIVPCNSIRKREDTNIWNRAWTHQRFYQLSFGIAKKAKLLKYLSQKQANMPSKLLETRPRKGVLGWQPWSSGNGWWLMFEWSWVRIPATGWTFFTLVCCKNLIVC